MALLDVRGLRATMDQGSGLNGIDLEVNEGETVGLLGSDAGSTILRLLAGTIQPDSGDVRFAGQSMTGWSERQRIAVGLCPVADQPRGPWWWPRSWRRRMTVEQMIRWAANQASTAGKPGRRADTVLEQFGLSRCGSMTFARLSGGERRRALLAQCLALEPKLLLLDEPLRDVDPLTAADLEQTLRALNRQGLGILLTRAAIDWQMRISHRCYLIKGGQVKGMGTPRDLLKDAEAIRLYFGDRYMGDDGGARPAIFLCYRREDSLDATHRLYEQLTDQFGKESVMMDVDSIPPGEDFRAFLHGAVGRCAVLLAVIGDHWLKAADDSKPRLDDPADFVRYEIATALELRKAVIPVLVGRAAMPSATDLPTPIQELAYHQAAEIRSGRSYKDHTDSLIARLEQLFQSQRAAR